MSNYDDGEGFAAGDDLDQLDWRQLRTLRRLIASLDDDRARRTIVLELLRAIYGDELDLR